LAEAGAEVHVMTTAVGAEVLAMVPAVRRTWLVPLRKPSPPFWKGLKQLLDIRNEGYDAALSLSASDRSLICTALSGAKARIAVLTGRHWWHAGLPLTGRLPSPDRQKPLFEQRLSLLRHLGWLGQNPGWSWGIPQKAEGWAHQQNATADIYLSISAFGSPHKEWPVRLWAEAFQRVWQARPQTQILLGYANADREKERARDLWARLKHDPRLKILDHSPTLPQLAAVLSITKLFVGLDSGILHLAVGMDKPTVSVFRDYEGKTEWAPRGDRHRVLSRFCFCHQKKCDDCGTEAKCLAGLPATEVAEAILAGLQINSRK